MSTQPPADAAHALARGIAAEFRRRLLGEQLPRISRCLRELGDARIWQRPAPHCNSAGNLVLHLCGNTTQWILNTFGRGDDARDRPAEFAADGGYSAEQLVARLRDVWTRACDAVEAVPVAELLRSRRIQARYDETGLAAILHVLEHCAGHAYQIYAWTKQATAQDLRFYDL